MSSATPTPPGYYRTRLRHAEHAGTTANVGAWAHSPEEAADVMAAKHPTYRRPDPATLGEPKKFGWSDGRLLFSHVEQSRESAEHEADNYKNDRRNCGPVVCAHFPARCPSGR